LGYVWELVRSDNLTGGPGARNVGGENKDS
jgi:hypothetical protein